MVSKQPIKIEVINWKGKETIVTSVLDRHTKDSICSRLENLKDEMTRNVVPCGCRNCKISGDDNDK